VGATPDDQRSRERADAASRPWNGIIAMFEKIKPGQSIRCTVVREPRRSAERKTVSRLMRQNRELTRQLKKAQEHRMRTLVVRSRGHRPWEVRRKSAKYAIPHEGATWTMEFSPHIAPDFASVSEFVKVEPA
jgi:hypothetical protein